MATKYILDSNDVIKNSFLTLNNVDEFLQGLINQKSSISNTLPVEYLNSSSGGNGVSDASKVAVFDSNGNLNIPDLTSDTVTTTGNATVGGTLNTQSDIDANSNQILNVGSGGITFTGSGAADTKTNLGVSGVSGLDATIGGNGPSDSGKLALFASDGFLKPVGASIDTLEVNSASEITVSDKLSIQDAGLGFTSTGANVTRTNLGLEIGTNIQAFNSILADIAATSAANNSFLIGDGTTYIEQTPAQTKTALNFGTAADKDVPSSGNASASEVVLGSDTRLQNTSIFDGSPPNTDVAVYYGQSLPNTPYGDNASEKTIINLTDNTLTLNASNSNSLDILPSQYKTFSTNSNGAFSITDSNTFGGNVAGALKIVNNLSDLGNTSAARTNLGLEIGTDIQAFNSILADIAATSAANNSFLIGDGATYIENTPAAARTALSLGSAALENIPGSGNASTSEVVLGSDTRLENVSVFDGSTPDTDTAVYLGASLQNFDNDATATTIINLSDADITISTVSTTAVDNTITLEKNQVKRFRTSAGSIITEDAYKFVASSTVSAINDLTDVNTGSPEDGDYLRWSANNSKWENTSSNNDIVLFRNDVVHNSTTNEVLTTDGNNSASAANSITAENNLIYYIKANIVGGNNAGTAKWIWEYNLVVEKISTNSPNILTANFIEHYSDDPAYKPIASLNGDVIVINTTRTTSGSSFTVSWKANVSITKVKFT